MDALSEAKHTFLILRMDRRIYPCRGHASVSRIFVCACSICGAEMKLRACSFKEHGGICRSCIRTRLSRMRAYEPLYLHFCRQAVKRGKENSLTYEDFLTFTDINKCHYCQAPITWARAEQSRIGNYWGYNLDRKDNQQGYIKGNCVVACERCNKGRTHLFTYEEWCAVGKALKEYRDARPTL
jgi:hypothetical protein